MIPHALCSRLLKCRLQNGCFSAFHGSFCRPNIYTNHHASFGANHPSAGSYFFGAFRGPSSLLESRLIFADKKPGDAGSGGAETGDDTPKPGTPEKPKVTVTMENARSVVADLTKEKKIDDASVSKILKILSDGEEAEKQKMIGHLQRATAGTLNHSELAKDLADYEKKPAKTAEEKKAHKKGDDEEELSFDIKKRITIQTGEAISTAEKLKANSQTSSKGKNPELSEKLSHFKEDFERLNQEDQKFMEPVVEQLESMVEEKHISKDLAEKLLNIDFNEPTAGDLWSSATKEIKDPKAKAALEKLHDLKKAEAANDQKIEEEFKRKMHEFREVANEIGAEVMTKAQQEKSLKRTETFMGIPLKPGQVVTYRGLKEDPTTKELIETKEFATIKAVTFEDIEIKDESGNVIKKVPSLSPTITVETIDPDTKEVKVEKHGVNTLCQWIDGMDVTEKLESKTDLEKSIGQQIKEGDKFEYRELTNAENGTYDNIDKKITIKKIDDVRNQIDLDDGVRITPGSTNKSTKLTFGQFAKWFKRNELIRPIESLEKLRAELRTYNTVQNELYKRDPAMYPPIELTEKEVLKYDDGSDRTFVIKKLSDNEIEFDNGDKFTPAAFLRWVKKNEVEKKSPEAEAKQETQFMPDDEIRKKAEDLIKARKEQEVEKRQELVEELPENMVLPSAAQEESMPSVSTLRKIWDQTTIMSLADMWELGSTVVEFIKRKWGRWQKQRIGAVGKSMFAPYYTELGAEFKSLEQSAENEEVNHHVETYRTMGIEFLKHELHSAPNKDILKAAITTLTEKGQMRWDDPGFWDSVNRLSHGIPCWVRGRTHLDDIEAVLDGWFGQDTFREFRNKQDSSYNSVKTNFEDNAGRLEGDPMNNGGLSFALQNLLHKHFNGEYVNPAEYEQYLHFAIDKGKLSFYQKLFFLIMGIGAFPEGHGHGHAMNLLHVDRAGAMETPLLNKFPILDHFTQPVPHVDEEGNPIYEFNTATGQMEAKVAKPNMNNFRHWARICMKDIPGGDIASVNDVKKINPGVHFTNFVNEYMAWEPNTRTRLDKAAKNPQDWDHDDMHFLAPMLGEETIEQITLKAGGARQNTSITGLQNAFAGFNNMTKVKMNMLQRNLKEGKAFAAQNDVRDITNLLRVFVRFDAILDRRFHHESMSQYTRFSDQEYRTKPLVDQSRAVKQHIGEVRHFIKELARHFGLQEKTDLLFKNFGSAPDAVDSKRQKNIVTEFGKMLEGEMSKLSPQQLSNLFADIEKKAAKTGQEIKGILKAPKNREQKSKTVADTIILQSYQNPEIESRVEKIVQLRGKLETMGAKTLDQIRAEKATRLVKILQDVGTGSYTPEQNDVAILDAEITRLQSDITKKEGGQATANLPTMPAANDNDEEVYNEEIAA